MTRKRSKGPKPEQIVEFLEVYNAGGSRASNRVAVNNANDWLRENSNKVEIIARYVLTSGEDARLHIVIWYREKE